MSPRFSPYRAYVVWKFLICFHVFSGAVALLADVVVSPLLLNPEEKPLEIGRPMQGMTPRLKLMLNLRFANELTQQQLQSPLCYLSLLRFSFLVS